MINYFRLAAVVVLYGYNPVARIQELLSVEYLRRMAAMWANAANLFVPGFHVEILDARPLAAICIYAFKKAFRWQQLQLFGLDADAVIIEKTQHLNCPGRPSPPIRLFSKYTLFSYHCERLPFQVLTCRAVASDEIVGFPYLDFTF